MIFQLKLSGWKIIIFFESQKIRCKNDFSNEIIGQKLS